MIGRLTGEVAHIADDHVLLDVGGVGYVIYCSSRTLGGLPPVGEGARLYTEMLVREDLLQLFGFPSMAEREWHRLLTTVQGVGAKVSLGILGTLGIEGVSQSISLADATSMRRAPGVGPKLATRIVNELKNKAPAMMATAGAEAKATPRKAPVVGEPAESDPVASADALSALMNLGYDSSEAAQAVARAAADTPDADAGALIKMALKALAPAG
jgi:Holliday junction DNA helicase RuvA